MVFARKAPKGAFPVSEGYSSHPNRFNTYVSSRQFNLTVILI